MYLTSRIIQQDSPYSQFEQRLMYADQLVPDYINFAENVPTWLQPPTSKSASHESFINYSSNLGDVNLKNEIIKEEVNKHSVVIDNSNILITSGALHALSLIFSHLSDHAKNILCQGPLYKNIEDCFLSLNFRADYFSIKDNGDLDDHYHNANLSEIDIVYINTPNNPTGVVFSDSSITKLLGDAKEYRFKVIFDMVYDVYHDDSITVPSPLKNTGDWENIFVVNSISKSYGCPGLRIGWVMSSEENIQQLGQILNHQMICISDMTQTLAANILSNYDNWELKQTVNRGRLHVVELADKHTHLNFLTTQAGAQGILRLYQVGASAFADYMLQKYKLLLAGTDNYTGTKEQFIRIPYGYPLTKITEAIELISQGLTEWQS